MFAITYAGSPNYDTTLIFDHPLEVLEIGYAADTRKELKGDPIFLNS